jgi:sec-independent protein translocase protein TatA
VFGLGAGEILLIAVFALIFIGPKKLPELAKNLGKSLREFQKAKDELLHQVHTNDKDQALAEKVETNTTQPVDAQADEGHGDEANPIADDSSNATVNSDLEETETKSEEKQS